MGLYDASSKYRAYFIGRQSEEEEEEEEREREINVTT